MLLGHMEHKKDENFPDFYLKWPKLKEYIPTEPGIMIVDFGCGIGEILKEIKLINPNSNCIGLDVSKEGLKKARNKLPNLDFKKIEDGHSVPIESNSVDFVFSSEVMEHIYDTESAFQEISRILKVGGRFLMTVPYHGFLKNLLITLFAFDKHFDPAGPHIRFFSKMTLHNELKKVGLKILYNGYYGRFWPISHSIYVLAEK